MAGTVSLQVFSVVTCHLSEQWKWPTSQQNPKESHCVTFKKWPQQCKLQATEEKFKTSFETIAAHRDFVAKVNFAGDLNCKIEIDGKFILAYATPQNEKEVNIIDANSFFSGDADELFDTSNGTELKPTYIVYGPIR
ncbi:hypothetical protein ANCDUO_22296 [Ancylostoma duodenale]|uniref:Ground-like domain-containing protein n=1 Tax=Ancylostoma duodenale TaxID=51022 RepID=A0A0C2FGA8_9BILA|nr:hypothetical protein ANCDUO_22296 [Ancylostoma duodenale]